MARLFSGIGAACALLLVLGASPARAGECWYGLSTVDAGADCWVKQIRLSAPGTAPIGAGLGIFTGLINSSGSSGRFYVTVALHAPPECGGWTQVAASGTQSLGAGEGVNLSLGLRTDVIPGTGTRRKPPEPLTCPGVYEIWATAHARKLSSIPELFDPANVIEREVATIELTAP
jgi:hypothetical protein